MLNRLLPRLILSVFATIAFSVALDAADVREDENETSSEAIDQITTTLLELLSKFDDTPRLGVYHPFEGESFHSRRARELAKIIHLYPPECENTQQQVLSAVFNLRSEHDRVTLIIILNEKARLHPSVIFSALEAGNKDEEYVLRNVLSHTVQHQNLSGDQITLVLEMLPRIINVKEDVVIDLKKNINFTADHKTKIDKFIETKVLSAKLICKSEIDEIDKI